MSAKASKTVNNKLAISSLSLSQHPSVLLDAKIGVASKSGFSGIEVVYSDLSTYSNENNLSILDGARRIHQSCKQRNLAILSLAPFENFEGNTRVPLEERLTTAKHWIEVACALGAAYLQVPASYSKRDCPVTVDSRQVIVTELRELADLAAAVSASLGVKHSGRGNGTPDGHTDHLLSIAYEPMSWSIHDSTLDLAIQTIQAVDRPNFGLCLDSFHILTKVWASPYTADGKLPDADLNLKTLLDRFKSQFQDIRDKVFYIQLSDGEKFDPPFSKDHPWFTVDEATGEEEAVEFTWSKHARPFPGETELGGYMPVKEFLQACVIDTGFKGWVSMEVFDRRMKDENFELDVAASRAKKSWEKLLARDDGGDGDSARAATVKSRL